MSEPNEARGMGREQASEETETEGHGFRYAATEEPEVEGRGIRPVHAVPGTDEPNEIARVGATEEPEVEGHGLRVTRATENEEDGPQESARAGF